jgi:transposase
VYAINPPAAARYPDQHSIWRKKSDPGDALVLANILRTDMYAHRPLPEDSDLGRVIAVLARAQQDAPWNRQQLANQLRSLLREYYPAALDAFATWTNGLCRPEARELLQTASTSTRAARLARDSGKRPSITRRWVKNNRLNHTGYLWAFAAPNGSLGAKVHYRRRRDEHGD